MGSGNKQAVSNILWAAVKGGWEVPKLKEAVVFMDGNRFVAGRDGGPLQPSDSFSVGNLAWSCARANLPASSLFTAINENASDFVSSNNGVGVATTAWAFAKLDDLFWMKSRHGVPNADFFQVVDDNMERLVDDLKLRGLSSLMFAAGSLSFEMPNLLSKVSSKLPHLKVGEDDSRR